MFARMPSVTALSVNRATTTVGRPAGNNEGGAAPPAAVHAFFCEEGVKAPDGFRRVGGLAAPRESEYAAEAATP